MSTRCRQFHCHRPIWVARPRSLRSWRRRTGAGHGLMPRGRGGPLRDFGPRIERVADFVDRFENELFGGMESFFQTISRDGMRVAMDVREEDDKYIITADLPGMKKSDVKIQVTAERVLTISGERHSDEQDEGERLYRYERRFGKFYRSFTLPKNADENGITAKASEGVFEVTIPKVERETGTSRVIDIE